MTTESTNIESIESWHEEYCQRIIEDIKSL